MKICEQYPFSLDDFEEVIDDVILKRGYDYYEAGLVKRFIKYEEGIEALVRGTEVYKVIIKTDKEENVMDFSCTCPYDLGPLCKHVVAVLFENQLEEHVVSKRIDLREMLNRKSKEALIELVLKTAANSSELYELLLLDHEDDRLLHEVVDKYLLEDYEEFFVTYDDYYDDYGDNEDIVESFQGFDRLIEKAESASPLRKLHIACFILMKAESLIIQVGEYRGYLDNYSDSASRIIKTLITQETHASNENHQVFLDAFYLEMRQANRQEYINATASLMQELSPLIKSKQDLTKINEEIDFYLTQITSSHERADMLRVKQLFIMDAKAQEDMDALIDSYLSEEPFKRLAIDNALAKDEWNKVLSIALRGYQEHESNRSTYLKHLVSSYLALNYLDDALPYLIELIRLGEEKYYDKIRAHYDQVTRDRVIDTLVGLKKQGKLRSRVLLSILLEESKYALILSLFDQEIPLLVEHLTEFTPEYQARLNPKVKEVVHDNIVSSSGKKDYENQRKHFLLYQQVYGVDAWLLFKQELMQVYPKRHALKEVLNKL